MGPLCVGNREVGLHPGRPWAVFSGLYKPPFLFPLALPFLFGIQQAPSAFYASLQQSCLLPAIAVNAPPRISPATALARTSRHRRIRLPSSAHTPHLTSTSCLKPLKTRRKFSSSLHMVCGTIERIQTQVSLPFVPNMKYNSACFSKSPCRKRCTQPRVCDLDMANKLFQRTDSMLATATGKKSTLYAKRSSGRSSFPCIRILSTSESGTMPSSRR